MGQYKYCFIIIVICLCYCWQVNPGQEDVDEDIDVDGEEEEEGFEEYTWCGQTRVRATSMLDSRFSGRFLIINYRGIGHVWQLLKTYISIRFSFVTSNRKLLIT